MEVSASNPFKVVNTANLMENMQEICTILVKDRVTKKYCLEHFSGLINNFTSDILTGKLENFAGHFQNLAVL